MKPTAIDRLVGLEWLKKRVDAEYKRAKVEAEEMLAEKRDADGTMELSPKAFGPEAGTYKYSKTRRKTVVEYHVVDREAMRAWLNENHGAAIDYAIENADLFGERWFEDTGEVPEWLARVEYEEPAKAGPPKLYGFNPEVVESYLGTNLMEGMQRLLGDGDE